MGMGLGAGIGTGTGTGDETEVVVGTGAEICMEGGATERVDSREGSPVRVGEALTMEDAVGDEEGNLDTEGVDEMETLPVGSIIAIELIEAEGVTEGRGGALRDVKDEELEALGVRVGVLDEDREVLEVMERVPGIVRDGEGVPVIEEDGEGVGLEAALPNVNTDPSSA